MLSSGVPPNQYTFPPLFKACSSSSRLSSGSQIHAQAVKLGLFAANRFVASAAMDMYMKHGELGLARRVFDGMPDRDVVAWNVLLAGYSQNGRPEEALDVFGRMRAQGVAVNYVSAASVVASCSQLRLIHDGMWIHSWVVKSGFEADVVIATALLDMYASCGELSLAQQVFQEMPTKDLIAWNCLISCCPQYLLVEDSCKLFVEMQNSGLKPTGSTLASILPAVARSGMLHLSKSCHCFILRNGLESDEFVLTAMMDAYAKSGDLVVAHKIFDMIPKKSVVAWSSLIAGYGTHGCGIEALRLFEKMLASGIKPNHVTYVGVLSACAHSGFVDKALEYFDRMVQHGITPRTQHFTCMVDLLGRAGLFDEAMDLISGMPFEPIPEIWGALLGGCRIHRNVELGKYAADRLFELNPSDPGFYVLLSNIYAAAGMWSHVRKVRSTMRERGLKKPPGWSSIEVGSRISCFVSGDMSHPESCQIYDKLEELLKKIGEIGYMPEIKAALHEVEEDVKESVLKGHSEKLAMAYGLLKTTPGTPIRIMKNLRTCEDCHSFAKYVSRVASREIILRDSVRFHHIKDGACTCTDYW